MSDRDLQTSKLNGDSHKKAMRHLSHHLAIQTYNWYFLLNTGGIIGTLALLSINVKKYTWVCSLLLLLFSLGLYFVIAASKLDQNNAEAVFDKTKVKTKQSYVIWLEFLSLGLFYLGLIGGVIMWNYFVKK